MSSFVTVVYGTHQYRLGCAPGTIMNDVLTQACVKAGLDADMYALRLEGKSSSGTLDLSLPFRLTSLHGGAKLNLVRCAASTNEAVIQVALNLVNTERKVAPVPARSSLWDLLCQFEAVHALKITHVEVVEEVEGKDGQRRRLQPVVTLMHKQYTSDQALKETSLAALGIKNGSAVVRVSFS